MFTRSLLCVRYQVFAKTNLNTFQKVNCHRLLHVSCRSSFKELKTNSLYRRQNCSPILSTTFIRHISDDKTSILETNDATSIAEGILPQIPDVPEPIVTNTFEIIENAEATLESVGLGGWTPSGMVQQLLNYIHITYDIPWWGTIACATIVARILVFPVVVMMQRSAAQMHNVLPGMQAIQAELNEARKMGDRLEVAKLTQELYLFMKKNNIKPLRSTMMPMLQAPIFISYFFALRGMVGVPIESMKEGGLWWFTDLTVPDPYFILPIITCTTVFITLEVGADSVKLQNLGTMKYVLRALPVIMFPFIMKFEGAILCYWCTTNLFSLAQVGFLKIPKIRELCQIPKQIQHDKKDLPISNKGFVKGFQDSWSNIKSARDLKTREMYDEAVFEDAGKGPIPKTYKENPMLRRHPVTNMILTKKR